MAEESLPLNRHFKTGSVILRREVLHGLPWMEQPVTVVHDGDDCLAVLLEPGAAFEFYEHPYGPHPWSAHTSWSGTSVLQVQRDRDSHAAWKFFDADGAFTHWYLNFQESLTRHVTPHGGGVFDTADLGLDIVFPLDGSPWQWKDVEDPDAMVARGRITQVERDHIREEASSVAGRLDAGSRWWSPWDDWRIGEPCPNPATTQE